ncbi:hypothetical protein Trydic_g23687 [Trypoxylus dichotomus]
MILLTFELVICRGAINAASFSHSSLRSECHSAEHLAVTARRSPGTDVRKTISKETNCTDGTHYGPLLRTSSAGIPLRLITRGHREPNRKRENNPAVPFSTA